MIFKPRIFISSTLDENLSVRSKIESFYSSVGAETMLYEKNLTPSVNQMTYRKDILDADFIILIIKNKYGTRTERGISGTHEELKIALNANIPLHVYIKLEANQSDAKEIIDEINNNRISYYYFKNDKDLLERIKETTFTIAKEIMLKSVEDTKLPRNTVLKLSIKHDYEEALNIISIVESMFKVYNNTEFDFVNSSLFIDFLGPIDFYHSNDRIYADSKIEEFITQLLSISKKYSQHVNDFTAIPGTQRSITVPILGEVMIYRCSCCNNPKLSNQEYHSIIEEFIDKFKEFKNYISEIRLSADLL